MRWRDIRFEKPTAADGDEYGEVVAINDRGRKVAALWDSVKLPNYHFWCPMSELPDPPDRIPDPPEGWRFVEKGEAFDIRSRWWNSTEECWRLATASFYNERYTYIVPIDPPAPPEPQYRPFANAAEFEPYRDKWWKHKDEDTLHPPAAYNNRCHGGRRWDERYEKSVFADGTPFGVRIDHAD
jgi:hypothetical protein